jgi:Thioredoxin-like domain
MVSSAAAAQNASPAMPATPVELTPEEDILFTNPDDPDASVPELASLLETTPKRRKGGWEESETIARKRSLREGKPMLIWFTDSRTSPLCRALSQELFSRPDFTAWAEERLVRLRVDAFPQVDDPDLSLDEKETKLVDIRNYVKRLKKQYKVLGHPHLVLVHPDGSVVGRYRGYKRGQAEYTWGLLKQGEAAFQHSYQAWRANLEKRGYRQWTDTKGRTVFAKLVRYSKGELQFVEPDGTRSKTHEKNLSNEDRIWIDEQKVARGL